MTLEQLLKELQDAQTVWDLSRVGVPAIRDGLQDISDRLRALEKKAVKK